MITGGSLGWRGALAAAAAAVWMPPAAGADWGVEQLMQALGSVKSSRARFVERKQVAILEAPLDSSGTLVYTAPDRLEKHTLKPRRESLVLAGGELAIEHPGRDERRALRLDEHPVLRAYVESIRSTLAGDLPTLRRYYEVRLDGAEQRWRLTLKPGDPPVREVVSEIRISGGRDAITRIEIIETGGDRSVMTITRNGP